MKAILVALFLVPMFSVAQTHITIMKDTTVKFPRRTFPHDRDWSMALILSNGLLLSDTSSLQIGKGTMPNGDFMYIATASNTVEAKLKANTKLTRIKVIDIKKKGKEKYGVRYTIYCEGGYHVQLEDAILAGEIIL